LLFGPRCEVVTSSEFGLPQIRQVSHEDTKARRRGTRGQGRRLIP
jgi:hypothetical protein